MRIAATVAIMLLLALVAACDDDDTDRPTATPAVPTESPTPGTPTPAPFPGLFIVAPDGTGTTALAGTRCWAGECVDAVGPVTREDPVAFPAGAELEWQAEGGVLDSISHAWVAVEDAAPEPPGNGTVAWHVAGLEFEEGDIIVPEAPGQYILVIQTFYQGGGDVQFGVLVETGE